MSIKRTSFTYEEITKDNALQDQHGDGRDLKFETLEHGGEFDWGMFPLAIQVTDPEGRTCRYSPIEVGGKAVIFHQSHHANNTDEESDRIYDALADVITPENAIRAREVIKRLGII